MAEDDKPKFGAGFDGLNYYSDDDVSGGGSSPLELRPYAPFGSDPLELKVLMPPGSEKPLPELKVLEMGETPQDRIDRISRGHRERPARSRLLSSYDSDRISNIPVVKGLKDFSTMAMQAQVDKEKAAKAAKARGGGGGGGAAGKKGPEVLPIPEDIDAKRTKYYGEDYLSRVATAGLQGLISEEQVQELKHDYDTSFLGTAEQIGDIGKDAQIRQGKATLDDLLNGVVANRRQQGIVDAHGIEQEERHEQALAERKAHEEAIKSATEDYEQAMTELKGTKVDPFGGSLGRKMAASIGMALGAFGAALTGGKNHAFQAISKMIDVEMTSQKANLNNQRQSLYDQKGLLGKMQNKFGDIDAAENVARSFLAQQVRAKLAKIAGGLTNERAIAKAKELDQQIVDYQDLHKLKTLNRAAMLRMKEAAAIAAAVPTGGGGGHRAAADKAGIDPKLASRYVKGFGVFANKTIAAEIIKNLSRTNGLLGQIDALIALTQAGSVTSSVDRARAGQMANGLILAMNAGSGAGALDAGSIPLWKSQVGNAMTVFGALKGSAGIENFVATLRQTRAQIQEKQRLSIEQNHYEKSNIVETRDDDTKAYSYKFDRTSQAPAVGTYGSKVELTPAKAP